MCFQLYYYYCILLVQLLELASTVTDTPLLLELASTDTLLPRRGEKGNLCRTPVVDH
jgi:hypothetical protein